MRSTMAVLTFSIMHAMKNFSVEIVENAIEHGLKVTSRHIIKGLLIEF